MRYQRDVSDISMRYQRDISDISMRYWVDIDIDNIFSDLADIE
jgi:hypothetical protein